MPSRPRAGLLCAGPAQLQHSVGIRTPGGQGPYGRQIYRHSSGQV